MIQLAILYIKNKAELTKVALHPCILPPKSPILPQNGPFSNFCKTYDVGTQMTQLAILNTKNKAELTKMAEYSSICPQNPQFYPKMAHF